MIIRTFISNQTRICILFIVISITSFMFRWQLYNSAISYITLIVATFLCATLVTLWNFWNFYHHYSDLLNRKVFDEVYLRVAYLLIDSVSMTLVVIWVFVFYVPNLLSLSGLILLQLAPFLIKLRIMKRSGFAFAPNQGNKESITSFITFVLLNLIMQLMLLMGIDLMFPETVISIISMILMLTPFVILITGFKRLIYIGQLRIPSINR